MPVYNAEAYLSQALDSLLAQSYRNFELHISDNASSDSTGDIGRAYARKDGRIRYNRNGTNVGILANFERACNLTSGDYFMWATYDDCWSVNYIEMLLECLLERPQAGLAAGRTLFMDGDGNPGRSDPDDAPPGPGSTRLATATQLMVQNAGGWLHGLYRRDQLLGFRRTLLTSHPWGGDVVFLLEMCLNTEVVGSSRAVMYKRVGALNNSHTTFPRTPRQTVAWQCWYAGALLRVILTSPLAGGERLDMLKTYASFLRRLFCWSGSISLAKTWIRACGHWLIQVDRT
jgi:hypothetical protein